VFDASDEGLAGPASATGSVDPRGRGVNWSLHIIHGHRQQPHKPHLPNSERNTDIVSRGLHELGIVYWHFINAELKKKRPCFNCFALDLFINYFIAKQ
jgi:hypothetical protein